MLDLFGTCTARPIHLQFFEFQKPNAGIFFAWQIILSEEPIGDSDHDLMTKLMI